MDSTWHHGGGSIGEHAESGVVNGPAQAEHISRIRGCWVIG